MSDTDYGTFLQSKLKRAERVGVAVSDGAIHTRLFPFQRKLVQWACAKGRCAIFADTGLGKTLMQLEWARLMGGRSLIVAPLSVARQTAREAAKLDMAVHVVRHASEVDGDGIYVTNYEMVEHFAGIKWNSVVLDESSILKALDGKTRSRVTLQFKDVGYRLCCTATPAPNDRSELGNHAEFLGILTMAEMLAEFFVHDEMEWRLKGHAEDAFFDWMITWSMSVRMPSDLGFDDDGFVLPSLSIVPAFVQTSHVPDGFLVPVGLGGIQGRIAARRATMDERVASAARLIAAEPDRQWIAWCGLNDEAEGLAKALGDGAVNLEGSAAPEKKAATIESFQDGKIRVLVTKPKIAGFGLNLQNASRMVFVGLSDSWEAYYQCIRRCWRFGQAHPVTAHIVLSELEREIHQNVMAKETVARDMAARLIAKVKEKEMIALGETTVPEAEPAVRDRIETEDYKAACGDSCELLREVPTDTVHLSVYSPPFADLYTYSASERDLGNAHGTIEFFAHYRFIIRELLRATIPGRLTAVHVADLPSLLSKHGVIGMRDFPGDVVRAYEAEGWIFHGRVTIDKDPQAQAIRTKCKGLLFVQLEKDASWSRPAIGDFILLFRKPGENPTPILPVQNGDVTRDEWISWARPVWYGIREGDTLQYTTARDGNDERHICPLQLGTIERCVKLWSNPGETVLTPFGGIGSEGYMAVKLGRKAILFELKPSYFAVAAQNLHNAATTKETLF